MPVAAMAAREALSAALGSAAWESIGKEEAAAQANLLRCIFGNPFRSPTVIPAAVRAWNGRAVPRLAESIYEGRTFDRLPVLADALEEAGCTDADLLTHCRAGGEHARGCWVVDLLTGRQ
jgi:hypothetical protein